MDSLGTVRERSRAKSSEEFLQVQRPKKSPRRLRHGFRPPFWFVVPAAAIYLLIVIVPNLQGFGYAFTNWDGFGTTFKAVGFENFARVLGDPAAVGAIWHTVAIAAIVTVGQNVIGLGLALGLNSQVKSRYVLRLIFFLPVVLTPIVSGYLWSYLLAPTGTFNQILAFFGAGDLSQDWLGNPNLVLGSICVALIWQGSGYSMVIYLAGLQGVPEELLEASAIDGAGSWRRIRSIILPLINGAIVVNVMLALIGSLKQFDLVFVMTGGGPSGASETLATLVYKTAFTNLQYPRALAQGVLLTIVVGVVAFVQFRLTQKKALI